VTGATSGIGRAIALQLARDGAEVIVHGRDAARGAHTVEAITAAGGRARFVAADLSTPAEISRLATEVGDVDVLVNNAVVSLDSVDGSKCSFDAHLAHCRVQHAVPQQWSTMEKGMFSARQGRRRPK